MRFARRSLLPLLFAALSWSAQVHALRLTIALAEPWQPVSEPARKAITDYTRAALGQPYRLGASGQDGFDCSGLVLGAYQAAGHLVPRQSQAQLEAGAPVDVSALRAGDLLFYRFKRNEPERLHVAIYVGGGRAIHASVSHRQVREVDITGAGWASRLVAARSLL